MSVGRWRFIHPLGFALSSTLLLLGTILASFYMVKAEGERVFMRREHLAAFSDLRILNDLYATNGLDRLKIVVDERAQIAAAGEFYGLFDPAGRHVSGNLPVLPPGLAPGVWRHTQIPTPSGTLQLHGTPSHLSNGYTLVVGRDLAGKEQFEDSLLTTLVVALALVVSVSLAMGLLLNWFVARRVAAIAVTARKIAAGDLTARAPCASDSSVEPFDQIGRSLNGMLDRIEQLMTEMRVVTDGLAHDLRTPLTRMRTAIENALDPNAKADERRAALEYAHAAVEQVISIFTSLLDIARAEAGLSRELMQAVQLDMLVSDVVELFSPLIEDAGQVLVVGEMEPTVITAHDALLRQALGNLLFNAARHAGEGARVSVSLHKAGGFVDVTVADDGPGVPADQLDRIGRRFVKLDQARGGPGFGLGLAIACAAAKVHEGEVRFRDNSPGLRATIRLRDQQAPISQEIKAAVTAI